MGTEELERHIAEEVRREETGTEAAVGIVEEAVFGSADRFDTPAEEAVRTLERQVLGTTVDPVSSIRPRRRWP